MATDVNLLASSMIGDGLNPSPYKEQKARADRLEEQLKELVKSGASRLVIVEDDSTQFLTEQLATSKERESDLAEKAEQQETVITDLHVAICQAVTLMNVGENILAHNILRKALIYYADTMEGKSK